MSAFVGMAVIIAIANQKGGVGKTTTAVNLSTALAAVGKKVLLVDFDPQGNATTGVGIYDTSDIGTSYSLITRQMQVSEVLQKTQIPGLTIIPSEIHLIGAEVELVNVQNREAILKEVLDPYRDLFDYIFVDAPPSMGILSLNALVASDGVIIPLQCEYYALEGLSYLLGSISRIKENLNRRLSLFGVLLTMFDRRNSLCISVENDVRTHIGDKVFTTVIPRNVKISEAPSFGKPVLIHDVKCAGSCAYMELAKEFLQKIDAFVT